MLIVRKSIFACAVFLTAGASAHAAGTNVGAILLSDDFNGSSVDPELWFIPTYKFSSDGTFVGRTQFRVTQDSSLPAVSGGKVCIPVQTYSPRGHSFYGSEMVTKQEFALGAGLDIVVRARMENSDYPGIVGGLFLYSLKSGSHTVHDEIDFELLTNVPDKVQTNIYGNERLGIGHSQLIPYPSGSIADDHTYEIKWTRDEVSWLIDGELVRTATKNIPKHAMRFYMNEWVPDSGWPEGYSGSIQPASSEDANRILNNLCVASVVIRSLAP